MLVKSLKLHTTEKLSVLIVEEVVLKTLKMFILALIVMDKVLQFKSNRSLQDSFNNSNNTVINVMDLEKLSNHLVMSVVEQS
jgi:hypothetical protein